MSVLISTTSSKEGIPEKICPPLSTSLRNLGFEIVDNVCDSDFYVAFNHSSKTYRSFIRAGGSISRAALIRMEPAAVYPAQYEERIERLYGQVITLGATDDESSRFAWPYYFNENPLRPIEWRNDLASDLTNYIDRQNFTLGSWKNRTHLLSMIASNKVSPISRNNYKLRRSLALNFSSSVLSVFGGLWGARFSEKFVHRAQVFSFATRTKIIPNLAQMYGGIFQKYSTFQGEILDKHIVICDSKFSLVIENDNSYVSEKLIDALLGGSIPIYIGGKCGNLGIPDYSVVTGLNSVPDILEFINGITDEEIEERLTKTYMWLRSEKFLQNWFGDNVFAMVAREISEQFKKLVR